MPNLFETLTPLVEAWVKAGYPCADFPAIAELLGWAKIPDPDTAGSERLRYLRPPQLKALETYWYLRLVEKTPHIFALYKKHFKRPADLLEVLGLNKGEIKDFVLNESVEALWERIKTDDSFVKDYKLEALRETLTLDYPSYILALAMGAGKTILIGAIIATEFVMALEYPQGPFVQNALVFAPGLTIIQSLREISRIRYDQLLPPRLCTPFLANVKLLFTQDGEKGIPVIAGSLFNIVVTNTEKIRIQKTPVKKTPKMTQAKLLELEEQAQEAANRRLTDIAALPHLAVFSDEAHHTYGNAIGDKLKRVRQTVDYLAQNTNVVCVVNTTGTPYFEKQPLRDVIVWYGLSQGITDGILKDVAGNIKGYEFEGNGVGPFVREIIKDFFQDYAETCLSTGQAAKIALYFPQEDDLEELRPQIEFALAAMGQSPTLILKNTSKSSAQEIADFDRLNNAGSPHRVILLVNKGTEGWNCPSLFACALIRRLTGNNFVLQAATRCLRQVPGNTQSARIYLSQENRTILDTQLQETFGETVEALNARASESLSVTLTLRKRDLPPLSVTQTRRIVIRKEGEQKPLTLARPAGDGSEMLTVRTYEPSLSVSTRKVLRQINDKEQLRYAAPALDVRAAAVDLAAVYRLPLWPVYDELRRLYGTDDIPQDHLTPLAVQIEAQTSFYDVREEQFEVSLALLKPTVFQPAADGSGDFVTQVSVPKDKEKLLLSLLPAKDNPGGFGFHYAPYNFDSNPEKDFLDKMLAALKTHSDEVADIYFTGGFTDPSNTDFFVEYQDTKGKWRTYTPDFLIHRKDGRWMIVEVKASRYKDDSTDGLDGVKANAARRWENLAPGCIKYEIFFAADELLTPDEVRAARLFVETPAQV